MQLLEGALESRCRKGEYGAKKERFAIKHMDKLEEEDVISINYYLSSIVIEETFYNKKSVR